MKQYAIIIYIILAGGLFFTFIDPQYTQVQALLEEKDENEQLLERANELRRKRQDLSDRYASISQEEKDQLLKVLPDTVDNVRLILDMTNIANNPNTNYGILLRGVSVSGDLDELSGDSNTPERVVDRTASDFGVINVKFSFSAPYEVAKMFMKDLENSLRIMDIQDITVSAGDTSDVYNFSVSLNTYWLR
jgi:hypothetical protein